MKFVYEYRTRENVRRNGVICAASREAAFAALRERGIRPSSVAEAPGFFNKLFGKHKRTLAICFLLLTVSVLLIVIFHSGETPVNPDEVAYADEDGFANPIERRQIWGDAAVINQAAGTQWRMVFMNPAERLLALFAQPGQLEEVFPALPESIHDDFRKSLDERLKIISSDLDEYKQMKCIVEGMKNEMREYIKAGGTIDGYLRRLVLRQREEAAVCRDAQKDLDKRIQNGEDAFVAWQEINRILREQGLQTIALPGSL